MRRLGRRSRIRAAGLSVSWILILAPGLSLAEEASILPGVEFSRLTLSVGAWCRYLVVDQALGIDDSTEIYIGIPSQRTISGNEAFWVEIESKLYGRGETEREVRKLLVTGSITEASPGDSLAKYILELYIKKGTSPIRAENPSGLEDLPLRSPTADSSWILVHGVEVSTPAGSFSCTKKERSVTSEKVIPAGRAKLIERTNDHSAVWISDPVPIFHLVRCLIERSRESEMIPDIPGIPVPERRESRTTAELIRYGFDAKPLLPACH